MAELKVRASLDPKNYQNGLNKMKSGTDRFSQQLGKIKGMIAGAFAFQKLVSFGKEVMDLGSDLYHNALQTRTTVEGYQALVEIFEHANGNAQGLSKTLLKLDTTVARALSGEQMYVKAFQDLGFSMDEIRGKNMEQLMGAIADKFKENGDTVEWAAGMYQIFGERNVKVLNEALVALADDGLQKTIDSMTKMNRIMTTDTAFALAEAKDNWADFWKTIKVGAAESYNWLTRKSRIAMGGFMGLFGGRGFMTGMQEQIDAMANEAKTLRDSMTGTAGGRGQSSTAQSPGSSFRDKVSGPLGGDQIAKIGGSIGGETNLVISVMREAVKVAASSLAKLEQIETNTRTIGEIGE